MTLAFVASLPLFVLALHGAEKLSHVVEGPYNQVAQNLKTCGDITVHLSGEKPIIYKSVEYDARLGKSGGPFGSNEYDNGSIKLLLEDGSYKVFSSNYTVKPRTCPSPGDQT